MSRAFGVIFGAALLFVTESAHAGGFYIPDHGTEALGRGAAFVAKADDPTALYYNPAGLARQRGTKLLLDANFVFHSYEFRRAGAFPDDPNAPATPWGQKPFPAVTNAAGPFTLPFFALSTDFGYFDRFTVSAGIFPPSIVGNRTFPLGVANAPAASRYDFVQSRSLLLYPTIGGAYRITPWLDVGLTGAIVIGKFDQTTVSFADLSKDSCPNVEYQPCDSRGTLTATGASFQAGIGVTVRPSESLQFGLSLKTPYTITANGQLAPESPKALDGVKFEPGAATVVNKFPLEGRIGGRYISLDGDFEIYDLELDIGYEGWAAAQSQGIQVVIPKLGTFTDINSLVVHGYKDTVSVRLGGAYNLEIIDGVGSVRAGAFFDSSSTDFPYTRLDFDTLSKIAGTLGIGYRQGPVTVDLSYAAIASIPRTVGTGQGAIRPINGTQKGQSVDHDGTLLPAVNEGAYRGFTHILSLGVTFNFDLFGKGSRKVLYGNPWEPGYAGEGKLEEKKEDKKDDEEKEKKDDSEKEEKEEKKPAKEEKKPSSEEEKPKKKPSSEEKKPEKKPEEKKPEKKPEEKKPEEKKPEKKPEKDWWED